MALEDGKNTRDWLNAGLWSTQILLMIGYAFAGYMKLFFPVGMAWGIGRRDIPAVGSDLGRRIERTTINNMESRAKFVPLIATIQIAG